MKFEKQRQDLVDFGKKMSREGLSPGTSGNLSIYIREENTVLISPSGIDYELTRPEDIVAIDLDGNILEGDKKPSSEWHLHTLFYKNKDHINAIVHTHSVYATCLSVLRQALEPIHYVIADANTSRVPCADYARFGTEKLAQNALEAAGKSDAVLLANHGMLACGKDLKSAFSLAKNIEYLSHLQILSKSCGSPVLLSEDQIGEVLEAFKTYGQDKK